MRIGESAWSSSFIWGRNHDTGSGHNLNSYLMEPVAPVGAKNFLTGRAELVDKDELFSATRTRSEAGCLRRKHVPRRKLHSFYYTRDLGTLAGIETGLGFNFSFYLLPGGDQTLLWRSPGRRKSFPPLPAESENVKR